ncbi:hypothetical protein EYF80_066202 [Liparis tanakae]|uniref:Uncharacterized protein n=1 Tax=Liparis tanakae TaxID=230148 RepID=A0A4Z2E4K7_9TELE|nr:hypothetical protein EYF80_066202 [Liparis tanakae]
MSLFLSLSLPPHLSFVLGSSILLPPLPPPLPPLPLCLLHSGAESDTNSLKQVVYSSPSPRQRELPAAIDIPKDCEYSSSSSSSPPLPFSSSPLLLSSSPHPSSSSVVPDAVLSEPKASPSFTQRKLQGTRGLHRTLNDSSRNYRGHGDFIAP